MRFTDISIFSIDSGDSDYAVRENYGNKGLCIVVRRIYAATRKLGLSLEERKKRPPREAYNNKK